MTQRPSLYKLFFALCLLLGSIVIGANYTQEMGLKPGDEFEIKLGYKHIRLIQIDVDRPDVELDDEEEDTEE